MKEPKKYWAVFGPSCMATFFRLSRTKREALQEIEKYAGKNLEKTYMVRRVEVRDLTAK